MNNYTLWVFGSRTFEWWKGEHIFERYANEAVDALGGYPDRVIHGGATGIDHLAHSWAHDHQIVVDVYPPQYHLYPNRVAPLERNVTLSYKADKALGIWDGRSKGTRHSLGLAMDRVLPMVFYVLPHLAHDPNNR